MRAQRMIQMYLKDVLLIIKGVVNSQTLTLGINPEMNKS